MGFRLGGHVESAYISSLPNVFLKLVFPLPACSSLCRFVRTLSNPFCPVFLLFFAFGSPFGSHGLLCGGPPSPHIDLDTQMVDVFISGESPALWKASETPGWSSLAAAIFDFPHHADSSWKGSEQRSRLSVGAESHKHNQPPSETKSFLFTLLYATLGDWLGWMFHFLVLRFRRMKLLKHRTGHQAIRSQTLPCCRFPGPRPVSITFPQPSLWFERIRCFSLTSSWNNVWCPCVLLLFCIRRKLGGIFSLPHFRLLLWLGQRTELFSLHLHGQNNTREWSTSHKRWKDEGLGD